MIRVNSVIAKWTITGIVFGLFFPIAGTIIQIRSLNLDFDFDSIIHTQLGVPILWIIDLAPIVLGITFAFIGKREYKLQQSNYLLITSNLELNELHTHLENLVDERTAELKKVSAEALDRADQFRTVADLAHSLASITNLDVLFQQTTQLVSQRMGYYHVGIFLLDDTREYAVLKSTNSEGGLKMLARNHRLRVGSEGIVGFVTSRGIPRIALDVGVDSVHFNNPDLPDTRSEVALPLNYGETIIGALDIQSTELNAFTNEDMSVLEVLANQLAIVIQNARSLDQARIAISQSEAATRKLIGQAWSNIERNTPISGYRYDGINPVPLTPTNSKSQIDMEEKFFSILIKLRGETIGSIRIKPPGEGQQWREDEIAVIQAVADRIALAAENARLFEQTTRRAERERLVSDITVKIRSTNDPDQMVRIALEELKQALGATEVHLEPHSLQNPDPKHAFEYPLPSSNGGKVNNNGME